MNKKYTDEELINELHRFYQENGKIPRLIDMSSKNGYPAGKTYQKHFGSWNNVLLNSGFNINKSNNYKNRICIVCGTNKSILWFYDKYKNFICKNCHHNSRMFIKGILDPNSPTGISVITEHVVYEVLGDCVKCNTRDDFHSSYDLISEKYGTVDVKSFSLKNYNVWNFTKKKNSKIPDYYVCIGFDKNKTKIEYVWIIPGNSNIVSKCGINISINNLQRVEKYQVDSTPYNTVYQTLDITTLPEFNNLYNGDTNC